METASPGGVRLQQANALAVDQQAEEARQQSAAQVEVERRHQLRSGVPIDGALM